jgi:hypothetical protein
VLAPAVPGEQFQGGILDPACGFGRIVEAARAAGHYAVGTDIVQRAEGFAGGLDWLSSDYPTEILVPAYDGECENVVCNPPFSDFEAFVDRAIDLPTVRKVAMIWLVRRLAAARWLEQTPLARIWLMTPRPSMPPGHVITAGGKVGGGTQDFCWLVWERGHPLGAAQTRWLRRDP